MSWRDAAACHDDTVDPAWFDPFQGKGHIPVRAMRICGGCPVRDACLQEALGFPTSDDDGVWGGTTSRARNEIRGRRLSRAAAMAAGDRIAGMRTPEEQAAAAEPWLRRDAS